MASCPLVRNRRFKGSARDQGLHRVGDVLGRDPLPGPDQRVPGFLPHVGQVHRLHPVRDPPRAAHVLALRARRASALLLLPRLVQRPDRHPPAPRPAGRGIQPGRRVPPDLAHRRGLIPRRPVQQPLRPRRRPVPRLLGDRPPVPRRQVAHQRVHVLTGRQPRLRPHKARPDQPQQGRPLPQRPPGPYPGSSSRLVFICPHKHMIPRRLPLSHGNLDALASQQLRTPLDAAVLVLIGSDSRRSRPGCSSNTWSAHATGPGCPAGRRLHATAPSHPMRGLPTFATISLGRQNDSSG